MNKRTVMWVVIAVVASLWVVGCADPRLTAAGQRASMSHRQPSKGVNESSTPVAGGAGSAGGARKAAGGRAEPDVVVDGDELGACEQRIERKHHTLPVVAILGASYTAGVGPDNATQSWATLLAQRLRWDAVIYGVPGAGYVRMGNGDRGPALRMLDHIGFRALDPSLVILQFGHDDIGLPVRIERQWIERTIGLIHQTDPGARIGLVTVFATRGHLAAAQRADRVIVAAARAADRAAIIMDPLNGHWVFPHARDGLHPTAAGDAWIARKAAGILATHGVRDATRGGAIICDSGIEHRAL